MDPLNKLKNLDTINRGYLSDYLRALNLRNLDISPQTIETKLWRLYNFLIFTSFKDSRLVTRHDIENFILSRKEEVTPITLQGELLEIKLFLRWLMPDQEHILFPDKIKRVKYDLPTEHMLTKDQIITLIEACTNQRDRALFMLLWDSAARLGEIIKLKVSDVQFDQYGGVIFVSGKTGKRRIRLTASVPDLQQWVNIHPLKDNPEAPLFVTHRRYGSQMRPLDLHTVQNNLKALARRTGIKNVHAHAFRHARLTDLTRSEGDKKGLNEMELRILAGWQRDSNMPRVYVHLSGEDVEKKVLANAGLIDEKGMVPDKKLQPLRCPRCKALNAYGSSFCSTCSMALDPRAVKGGEDQAIQIQLVLAQTLVELLKEPKVIRALRTLADKESATEDT